MSRDLLLGEDVGPERATGFAESEASATANPDGRTATTLFIVGVGPGDPELLTLKAARIIAAADVVAYPETSQGSLAARIADAHIGRAERLPFRVPMGGDGAAEAAYDAAAVRIAARLDTGLSVALLCEGDPMLYGSAASLMARLDGRPAEIVPGVAAVTAAAASAGLSLVRGTEALTILPATAAPRTIADALARPDALAIYKIGRHFDGVAAMLRAAGRRGTLVVRATQADEEVLPLAEAGAGAKPYFSTLLVPAMSAALQDASHAASAARPTDQADIGASSLAAPPADGHAAAAAQPTDRTGVASFPGSAHEKPGLRRRVAIVALGPSALPTAERARTALTAAGYSATVHGLARRLTADAVDVPFVNVGDHLRALFAAGDAVVGLFSAGIVMRTLGPLLADKPAEPPVIAMAEDGGAVVPLLGAHRGGTALAGCLAAAFGVAPATTTQGEVRLGIALDDPPDGWVVADLAPFKALAADCAAGGGATVDPALTFLSLPAGPTVVRATIGTPEPGVATYIARRVALGMGAERGASPAVAVALARKALAAAGIDPRAVAVVASLDLKADEAALAAVADDLAAPLRLFTAAELDAQEPRLANPSEIVRAAVGVAGVAEAAALAAAGQHGALIVPKIVGDRVTLAMAEAPSPIARTVGRSRGKLVVVGTGPGARRFRTAQTLALIAAADAFVGYTLYLDLIDDLRAGRPRHDFALGDEEERVKFALELAGTGQTIALVSSGDPGIYAMASLALELLDGGALSDAARRVALEVAPGISAAQAAAADVGAPLGHDFAFISLSDLMTPWATIERRLAAAAVADFAVALYNPRSVRRSEHLARALEIFAAVRAPETPVVVASSVGRPAEAIVHTTLGEADPGMVDMLATVLVGASTTRRFVRGDGRSLVYTPRGYAVEGSVTAAEPVPAAIRRDVTGPSA